MTKRKNTLKRGGWVEKIGDWLRLSIPFATTVMFDQSTLEDRLSEISAFSDASMQYHAGIELEAHPVRFVVESINLFPKRLLEAYLTGQWTGENGSQGIVITGRVYPNVAAILMMVLIGAFLFFAFDKNLVVGLIMLVVVFLYLKASLGDRDKTLEFFMDYLHDKAKYKNKLR